MINLRQIDRIMIVGQTGTGKSNAFIYILNSFFANGYEVLIYDSEDEYSNVKMPKYVPKDNLSLEEFDKVCRAVWRKGNIIFGIEAIDYLTNPKKPLSFYFKKLVGMGRKRGIGLVFTTRRIADVNKYVCSQVHKWLIYRQYLPNDIAYLKQFVGEIAEKTANLPNYYFIYYSNGEANVFKPLPKVI